MCLLNKWQVCFCNMWSTDQLICEFWSGFENRLRYNGVSESEFGDGTSSRFEGDCAQGCDAKIKDENLLVIKIKDDMRNEEVKSG